MEMQTMNKIYLSTAVILLIAIGGYMARPRGLRNNNPTNIRFNPANNWNGQIGQDSAGFAKFDTAKNGIRAGAKLIRNYQALYGLNTIEGIISRWAPTEENDTQAYIDQVSKHMAMPQDAYLVLSLDTVLTGMLQAIIKHENGVNPYSTLAIYEAVNAAG